MRGFRGIIEWRVKLSFAGGYARYSAEVKRGLNNAVAETCWNCAIILITRRKMFASAVFNDVVISATGTHSALLSRLRGGGGGARMPRSGKSFSVHGGRGQRQIFPTILTLGAKSYFAPGRRFSKKLYFKFKMCQMAVVTTSVDSLRLQF